MLKSGGVTLPGCEQRGQAGLLQLQGQQKAGAACRPGLGRLNLKQNALPVEAAAERPLACMIWAFDPDLPTKKALDLWHADVHNFQTGQCRQLSNSAATAELPGATS